MNPFLFDKELERYRPEDRDIVKEYLAQKAANEEALDQRELAVRLAKAGQGIGSAIAHVAPDTESYDKELDQLANTRSQGFRSDSEMVRDYLRNVPKAGDEAKLELENRKMTEAERHNQAMEKIALQAQSRQSAALQDKQEKETQKLTKGEEAVDKSFAKSYDEYVARGGYADVQKNIDQLKEVSRALETKSLTGALQGQTPEWIRRFTNPEALAARDKVHEVAQRNARMILGPQFTEKEGQMLMARSFDPALPEAENKRRVDALIKQIEEKAKATEAASKYYEQGGSLKGYKASGRISQSGADEIRVVKGIKYKKVPGGWQEVE